MELHISGYCVLVSALTFHVTSASITSLSSDQLTQFLATDHIVKLPKETLLDPLLFRPDDHNQYVDDTIRIAKRNLKDIDTIAAADVARSALAHQTPNRIAARSLKKEVTRDIVFEVVKQLIHEEKKRKRFELENPVKYRKMEQALWDRLRLRAAAELLTHQVVRPKATTERVYESLKRDFEEEPTKGAPDMELFPTLKAIIQDQFIRAKFNPRILYKSTLKPDLEY